MTIKYYKAAPVEISEAEFNKVMDLAADVNMPVELKEEFHTKTKNHFKYYTFGRGTSTILAVVEPENTPTHQELCDALHIASF